MEKDLQKLTKQQIQQKIQDEYNVEVNASKLKKNELINKYIELQQSKQEEQEEKPQEQEVSVDEIPVEITKSQVSNGIFMTESKVQKEIKKQQKKCSTTTIVISVVSSVVIAAGSVCGYLYLTKKQ